MLKSSKELIVVLDQVTYESVNSHNTVKYFAFWAKFLHDQVKNNLLVCPTNKFTFNTNFSHERVTVWLKMQYCNESRNNHFSFVYFYDIIKMFCTSVALPDFRHVLLPESPQ